MKINLREFHGFATLIGILMVLDAAFLASVRPSWFFLHNLFYLGVFSWALINLGLVQSFMTAGMPLHSPIAALLFTAGGFPLAVQAGVFLIGDCSWAEVSRSYLLYMAFTGVCFIYLNLRLQVACAAGNLTVEVDPATARFTGFGMHDWLLRWFLVALLALVVAPLSTIRNLSSEDMQTIEHLALMRFRLPGVFLPLALIVTGGMLRHGLPVFLGAGLRLALLSSSLIQLQRMIPAKPLGGLIGEGLILETLLMIAILSVSALMMMNRSQGGDEDLRTVPEADLSTSRPAFGFSRIEYGLGCLLGLACLLAAVHVKDPVEEAKEAIRTKDLPRLTAILEKRPELLSWSHNFNGTNLFYTAARDGSSEILRYLADRGIDTNRRDDSGYPATFWMMDPGHLSDLRYLADKGTDFSPDFFFNRAVTGIHRGAEFAILDFLLAQRRSKGIPLAEFGKRPDSFCNQYSKETDTANPIALAAKNGNPYLCEYLLRQGFVVDNAVVRGAIDSSEFEQLLPFLRAHARIVDDSGSARPLVFDAVRIGRVVWFDELVARGMNPLAVDPSGNTAYHAIAEFPIHRELIAARLASFSLPIDAVNKAGKTPLWLAIEHNQPFNLGFFLRLGADPRKPGPGGQLPLDFARNENNPNVTRILERALSGSSER